MLKTVWTYPCWKYFFTLSIQQAPIYIFSVHIKGLQPVCNRNLTYYEYYFNVALKKNEGEAQCSEYLPSLAVTT